MSSSEVHQMLQPDTSASSLPDSSSRLRALVVDDDPLFRTLLVGMLQHDYDVTASADGKDGFYKALETPPDVAIVDVQMPVWDGLRTLKAFREHEELGRVSVVMLTSDTSRETVMAAIRAGADDYVIKTSLSRHDLLQKLAQVYERRHGVKHFDSEQCDLAGPHAAGELGETVSASKAEAKKLQAVMDAWE